MECSSNEPSLAADTGINEVALDEPWRWLSKGWGDLWHRPSLSLGYGFVVVIASMILTSGLISLHIAAVVLALGAGFMLLGPILAVGLYEKSRRIEANEQLTPKEILFVATKSPVQIGLMGFVLCLALLIWIRIATLLFALFYGPQPFPPLDQFLPSLLFTAHGLGMLLVGTVSGGLIAFTVFAVSAISIPILMVEDSDAPTAIVLSVKSVLKNSKPMLLWAWMIMLLTIFGLATGYLGLIVVFPLVGHATWHAYRSLRGI